MENYNKSQYIYEQIMSDLSVYILSSINEAYDNQLLEEYDIKNLLNTIYDNGTEKSKVLIKKIKKLLIYIIKKLQETNQYKKAEQIANEYKMRITKYINEHKKITPRRMLKIMITVLTIYGGVSLVKDCNTLIKNLNNEANNDYGIEYIEVPEEDLIVSTDNNYKDIQTIGTIKGKIGTPYETYIANGEKVNFTPSDEVREFIKSHENLLLYPYYANQKEKDKGMVTIGYGHVVLESDGALYKQVQKLKKAGKITKSFIRHNGEYILNPKHCEPIITKQQAEELYKNDIKIARNRAIRSIKDSDADNEVKSYILQNPRIMDGLTSLCYNSGYLSQAKYQFIRKGLVNCRYDKIKKCINPSDYELTCNYFAQLSTNHDRRVNEYKLFLKNANISFDKLIN